MGYLLPCNSLGEESGKFRQVSRKALVVLLLGFPVDLSVCICAGLGTSSGRGANSQRKLISTLRNCFLPQVRVRFSTLVEGDLTDDSGLGVHRNAALGSGPQLTLTNW